MYDFPDPVTNPVLDSDFEIFDNSPVDSPLKRKLEESLAGPRGVLDADFELFDNSSVDLPLKKKLKESLYGPRGLPKTGLEPFYSSLFESSEEEKLEEEGDPIFRKFKPDSESLNLLEVFANLEDVDVLGKAARDICILPETVGDIFDYILPEEENRSPAPDHLLKEEEHSPAPDHLPEEEGRSPVPDHVPKEEKRSPAPQNSLLDHNYCFSEGCLKNHEKKDDIFKQEGDVVTVTEEIQTPFVPKVPFVAEDDVVTVTEEIQTPFVPKVPFVEEVDVATVTEEIQTPFVPKVPFVEEVDVATVTEEIQTPFVPKVQVPFRKRQKRGRKSQKAKKNSLSPKTSNAAMKRNMTRITTVRRTYRRKINNSVETTSSNSLPSSSPSSRYSLDVEDADKRENHNSAERKRREVLRTDLQNLRLCVPSVQNNPKATKVKILNCATEYITEMKQRDQECAVIKNNLRNKKKALEMKLKSLAAEFKFC